MSLERRIAFIDDEPPVRQAAEQWLGLAGLKARCFPTGAGLLAALFDYAPLAVISDVKMPGMDGLTLLKRIREKDPDLPVILITGHGDVPMAVEAMQAGAYNFIEKPYSPEFLLEIVERAVEQRKLWLEVKRLRQQLDGQPTIESRIIGNSAAISAVREAIVELSATDANVVILGATGTGKELAARCLHEFSPRSESKFIAVNCRAVSENIFESEIFGHEKGAFGDASFQRTGKLEHADGGTMLLDEIESMPVSLQVKLLRVVKEQAIERLGSNSTVDIDVRFVTASKADLHELALKGEFREDLFYRLNVATVVLPPLNKRKEDIPLLFDYFSSQAARRYDREWQPLSTRDLDELFAYPWLGNVRELRNVAERYVLGINATGRTIRQILRSDKDTQPALESKEKLPDLIASHEKRIIEAALKKCGGYISKTTDMLGIPRRTLYEKMSKHGIEKSNFIRREMN